MATRSRTRRLAALISIALVLMASMLISIAPLAAASNYTVTWESPQNVTGMNLKAVFPSVVVDGNNKTHIVFSTDDPSSQDLWYINNVNGSFSAPQLIQKDVGTDRNPFFTLTLGPNNTLHLVYSWLNNDKQIYYRQASLSGATANWSAAQRISDSGAKAVAPSLVVDAGGNAYITWSDQRCGNLIYNVFYRTRQSSGALSGTSPILSNCGTGQGKSRLVITSNGKAHAVLTSSGEVYYARLEGSTWVSRNISESPGINSDSPALTTDGTAIYIAWDEGVNGHDIDFRRSIDGGQNWSTIIPFSNTPQYAAFPSATYSATSRRVYVAWQDQTGTGVSQDEIWYREFDPSDGTTTASKRLTTLPGTSALPSIAAGPNRAALAWHDRTTGLLQIFDMGGTIAGGCSGTLVLEGGAIRTKKNPISGVVTPSGCSPDQMQISVDAPPTGATPKDPFSSNISVTIPANGRCSHTVYVQLYANGVTGSPAQASIIVDNTVDATVQALNPHMANLPKIYTPIINDIVSQQGASDGAPNYTRDRGFFLSINDNGDCVGLTEFDVEGGSPGDVQNNAFGGVVALPGDSSAGMKQFHVVISDTLANQQTFPENTMFGMVYDPANTYPSQSVTNTDGLPVLASGGAFVDDSGTQGSILRTLTFSNISVTDNQYGQHGENLPAGKQFWGVWLANSRQDNDAGNPNLQWFPVPVPVPDVSFSVQWNLFNGLGYGPDPNRAGDYYVYARFLDGAGNPSEGFLKAHLTLDPGYQLPMVQLPLVVR